MKSRARDAQRIALKLQVEKKAFHSEAGDVSCEAAVTTNDAVARNDNRNGVFVVGESYSPHSAWSSYVSRDVTVRRESAVWNSLQSLPYVFLEGSSFET